MENIKLINADCIDIMATYPDKYFDLAIVDPPYGINRGKTFGGKNWKKYDKKDWDITIPNQDYFNELYRISKNQILFGANYFPMYLKPSMGWVVWDKGQDLTMSDGEVIYTSFQKALRIVEYNRCYIRDNGGLLHPTQKPIKLYKWLLKNYSDPSHKIIDTHGGSMSSVIACYDFGIKEMVCIEKDVDYFNAAQKRFNEHVNQQVLQL